MRSDLKLAVIGGGRMGEALVGGFLSSGILTADRVAVAEIDASRREVLARRFGVAVTADGRTIVGEAGAVLLAVKPQQIDEVVGGLADAIAPGTVVVSIAAGVSTARLESLLERDLPVVRVMPNQAALVGKAVSAISAGAYAEEDAIGLAVELMGAVGTTVVLPESLQDAAVALNGSGPAYVYLFAETLIQAGVSHGLTRAQASDLVVGTIAGAAEMLAAGGHPCELMDAVASPGGTTIAAVEALERAGFRAALLAAVEAAARRAAELGG